ncbi:Zn(II)2Cys6 transcription factor [Aspergillus stella-maris]|uniref:Zn(II)2Cys6 transcription factor n=1 Tax=Aspergillus stella-maris TaxID=1810926 RepID=UPI003CCDCFD8
MEKKGLVNKSCDRCRAKKIKCTLQSTSPSPPVKRAEQYPGSGARSFPPSGGTEGSPELYIDYLLEQGTSNETYKPTSGHDQLTTLLGPSPNISFFPAKRVHAICHRLGNNRLEHLLESMRGVISAKLKISGPPLGHRLDQCPSNDATADREPSTSSSARDYIQSYFELVHPFYPFLPRQEFKKRALASTCLDDVAADKTWSCLYYAVLAVGCQYQEGGSYEARSGRSWVYFEQSMALAKDITFSKGSLTTIQALMTLAVFCQSLSGFGFQSVLIAEAAIMAQNIGINRLTSSSPDSSSTRTFWVLYCMEKTSCFVTGKVPTLQDAHISCPLPSTDIWAFGDYDWFLSVLTYARITSKIHSRLLTITSVPRPWSAYYSTINSLRLELDQWRASIPPRFRPGQQLRAQMLPEPHAVQMALRISYYYYYANLALLWTLAHCGIDRLDPEQQDNLKTELMQTARGVLELTSWIEISPSTPIAILALTPLSALIILFDLIVQNPTHPETSLNLALLDIASGHFSRIEYASKGVLPGSLISAFAHLARQYIYDLRHAASTTTTATTTTTGFAAPSGPSTSTPLYQAPTTFPSRDAEHAYHAQAAQAPVWAKATLTFPQDQQREQEHPMTPSSPTTILVSRRDDITEPSGPPIPVQSASTNTSTGVPFAQLEDISSHPYPRIDSDSGTLVADFPTGDQDQMDFSQVDAMNADVEDPLGFLGVDLMALFDPSYPVIGFEF